MLAYKHVFSFVYFSVLQRNLENDFMFRISIFNANRIIPYFISFVSIRIPCLFNGNDSVRHSSIEDLQKKTLPFSIVIHWHFHTYIIRRSISISRWEVKFRGKLSVCVTLPSMSERMSMISEFASLFHPYSILFYCDKFPYACHLNEASKCQSGVAMLFQLHFLDYFPQHCLMLWNGLHFITYAIQN